MQVIPLDSTGASRVTVGLYDYVTYWNPAVSMWYLDLYDANDAPIALGLALVPNINLLNYDQSLVATVGQLRVVDLSGSGNADSTSLGNTAILSYWSPGEFESSYPTYDTPTLRAVNVNIDELFTVV